MVNKHGHTRLPRPPHKLEVNVFYVRGNGRSQRLASALTAGARAAGYLTFARDDASHTAPRGEIAAFYGFEKDSPRIMRDYVASGRKVIFLDLGYWGRQSGGRFRGFHKVAVNDRHPTAYVMNGKLPLTRLQHQRVIVRPWRLQHENSHILLAGMSAKSAESYGLKPEEWERWAASEIRKHTQRPILYRPKPSWRDARGIPGTNFDDPARNLELSLNGCHAVVTHHSNVAIDALAFGVPAFVWDGAAAAVCPRDLSQIEAPPKVRHREKFLGNLAWCQWSVEEMINGSMFKHLRSEGLIP